MNLEEVKAVFTLAGIEVQRVWKLPNGYMGDLEPLTPEQIQNDTPGVSGYVDQGATEAPSTSGVVRAWMSDYHWRYNRPAWLVKTPHGLFEVTERKRVLRLDWRETDLRKIVTEEDTTKSETMVDCWKDEDAIRYLKALVS